MNRRDFMKSVAVAVAATTLGASIKLPVTDVISIPHLSSSVDTSFYIYYDKSLRTAAVKMAESEFGCTSNATP